MYTAVHYGTPDSVHCTPLVHRGHRHRTPIVHRWYTDRHTYTVHPLYTDRHTDTVHPLYTVGTPTGMPTPYTNWYTDRPYPLCTAWFIIYFSHKLAEGQPRSHSSGNTEQTPTSDDVVHCRTLVNTDEHRHRTPRESGLTRPNDVVHSWMYIGWTLFGTLLVHHGLTRFIQSDAAFQWCGSVQPTLCNTEVHQQRTTNDGVGHSVGHKECPFLTVLR